LPSRQDAAAELLRRRTARRSFPAFAASALATSGLTPAAHHKLLCGELQWLADTPGARLMVCMPPGSAKSTYASVLFPPWFMQRAATAGNVIAASHTATLAEAFSARAIQTVREHGRLLGFDALTKSVLRWRATNGAEYLPAGVGGAVTGFRADLGMIDDPVKSREEADSETMRNKAWAWYQSDFLTRLRPGGRVALIMTRWHEDDLGGRILQHEAGRWRVVRLPALAEADDPLGRAPGAPLWSDDAYGYGAELHAKRDAFEAAGQSRTWHALYQQSPKSGEGFLFTVAKMATMEARPAGGKLVRAWDLAGTEAKTGRDPDYTAGVLLARMPDGRYCVLDVTRLRGGPEAVEAAIVNTAAQDGRGVTVALPQDPGQAGKMQAQVFARRLAGYVVKVSPETGDKATRAAPAAAQVNVGNVSVVAGAWNRAFLEELRDFPAGRHDDQVDAFSRAFGVLATGASPARVSALT